MVDIEKTEKAIRDLLVAIGEDPDRPGLAETPKRCAKMYAELLAGMDSDAQEHLSKQFDVPHSEFLLEKDIPFYSLCEHHLLPFFGKAHIALSAEPIALSGFPSWRALSRSTRAVCSCRSR